MRLTKYIHSATSTSFAYFQYPAELAADLAPLGRSVDLVKTRFVARSASVRPLAPCVASPIPPVVASFFRVVLASLACGQPVVSNRRPSGRFR